MFKDRNIIILILIVQAILSGIASFVSALQLKADYIVAAYGFIGIFCLAMAGIIEAIKAKDQ